MIEREQSTGVGPVSEAEIGELSSRLHSDIRRHGIDPGTADDLVQEAWLRTLRSLPPVESRERLGRWLSVVGRHLVAELRRTNAHRSRREREAARPERQLAAEPEVGEARILALLRSLPDPYRTVLRLHFLEDRPVDEIARELGSSPGTVRSQLGRGIERLRARFVPRPGERGSRFGLALLAWLGARLRGAPLWLRWTAAAGLCLALVGLWRAGRGAGSLASPALVAAAPTLPTRAAEPAASRSPLVPALPAAGPDAPAPSPEPRSRARLVEGFVRAPDGTPMAGARLWLGERSREGDLVGQSDALGRYSVPAVDPARFLWASHATLAPSRRVYVASIAAGREHDLVLTGSRGRLELRVLTPDHAPAAGVRVALDGEPGTNRSHTTASGALELAAHFAIAATTDERGLVELVKPDLAFPVCEVHRDGELLFRDELELSAGDQRLELVLPRPPELRGIVLGPDGSPVPAEVEVHQFGEGVVRSLVTDERGRFHAPRLVSGDFAVMARVAGEPYTALHRGEIADGEHQALQLRTSSHSTLHGRAVAGAGHEERPLAGARVMLYRSAPSDPCEDDSVLTDAAGRFAFVCQDEVEYRLELQIPGEAYPCGTAESLRAGDEVELRVQPELRGREPLILEFAGGDLAQLPTLVSLRRSRPRIGCEVPVDAAGRVSVQLPRGAYELSAWVPGVGYWRRNRPLQTGPDARRIVLPRPGEVELVLELPPGCEAIFEGELFVDGYNPFGFDPLGVDPRGAFAHRRRFEPDGTGRRYSTVAFPGRRQYLLRAPGFADQQGWVGVREGQLTRLRIAPTPGELVELRLDYPRAFLAGEGLELWARGGGDRQRLPVGDAKSYTDWLEFAVWLPAGTISVEARTTHGLSGTLEVRADAPTGPAGVRRLRLALGE